jgi:ribosomal protein S25
MGSHAEQVLDDLKQNPKVEILYHVKGKKAIDAFKRLEYADEVEEGKKWASQLSSTEKKKAEFIIYSLLKRVHREIRSKLLIGENMLGSRYTYEKGMEMLDSVILH